MTDDLRHTLSFLTVAACVTLSPYAQAQNLVLEPVITLQDRQNTVGAFESSAAEERFDVTAIGVKGNFGAFSLEILSDSRPASAAFDQRANRSILPAGSDQATLGLTGRYRPLPFVEFLGGIRRNRVDLESFAPPDFNTLSDSAEVGISFLNRRQASLDPFAGLTFDLPDVAGGSLSIGGLISLGEGRESGEYGTGSFTPAIEFAPDIIRSLSPDLYQYEYATKTFSYQLQASWIDEMSLSSQFYSRLSYGIDVTYAVQRQHVQAPDQLDYKISGNVIRGIAKASLHF